MATLKDVSRRVGLSVTQVSRALNAHDDVSEATKARVRKAAEELGYVPNLSARKLKSGRSGIVSMIVPPRSETVEIELLMETVMGLSAEFSRRGLQFVLHVLSDGEDPAEAHGRMMRGGSIDGVVVTDPLRDDPRIACLEQLGAPFVVHGRDRIDAGYPFVDIDHWAIGRMLAEALLRRGCRRIALVDGPGDRPYSGLRRAGVEAALSAQNLALAETHVLPGPMTEARGRAAAGALAEADGVIAGNMMLAAGLRDGLGATPIAAHDDDLLRHQAGQIGGPLIRTRAPLSDAWTPLCDALAGAIRGKPASQTLLDVSLIED
ncbi:LacI family transcriptional regulator [Roseivivax sp. GX 12232]|uniref:LacI family DNA-binding transcriptional regulator n=1 Tax=Roseivivax sp. GX 12232 TaxID=2900547 RepID=UPI001E49ADA1|nr:LacI family DNA-binding transcriptional regulator [Roseivivax sp. GX 12232]MCE0504977.1 LacI family transcriptional regulator [Roseivivax sp. GX 12232]